MMNDLLGGKLVATFSAIPPGARLLATRASISQRRWREIADLGVAVVGLGSEVFSSLGLSAEDLLLQPGHPGLGGLELLGQLDDPGPLTANGLLELPSPVFPRRFPFDRPGMLPPPVVGLLAEFNQHATGLGTLNGHAPMVQRPALCVQQ